MAGSVSETRKREISCYAYFGAGQNLNQQPSPRTRTVEYKLIHIPPGRVQ